MTFEQWFRQHMGISLDQHERDFPIDAAWREHLRAAYDDALEEGAMRVDQDYGYHSPTARIIREMKTSA